ncbi:MAG TPA: hypothetical protein VI914_03955 [Thermodesulfobacteriota bacterium]|nr:hypothetical protein [Thermodesulfobacteriota bacterium]HZX36712.1 hypothetical protein [Thermodesulfobacteriota bacterium]
MKNQYFADVNDYRKYGLLRLLSNKGSLPIAICWMLTRDDGRNDGNNERYVKDEDIWRHYDPDLFDILKDVIIEKRKETPKDVKVAKKRKIVPGALYYDPPITGWRIYLTDNSEKREKYFDEFFKLAKPCKLIFFDPDNGLEVQSVKYGRRGSSKYLYWRELECAVEAGHSVLLYQHFPREKRVNFIVRKAKELLKRTGKKKVYSFRTAHVVFFLVPQNERIDFFNRGIQSVDSKWNDQIEMKKHTPE